MKVAHFNTYLRTGRLYYNLFSGLESWCDDQLVMVPAPKMSKWAWDPDVRIENVRCETREYQELLDRVVYTRKIRRGIREFRTVVEAFVRESGVVAHAHNLFSDGGLCWRLSQIYGFPYVVTVRNTDINFFWRWKPHLRRVGIQILMNASAIVFLGDAYRNDMMRKVPARVRRTIQDRVHTIPNGVDSFWLKGRERETVPRSKSVLYVGRFNKNKNIPRLVEAVRLARETAGDLRLKLVGGEGEYAQKIQRENDEDWIEYLPPISDKVKLARLYSEAGVFAMVSLFESFGLVYVEALSQGCPVVYTRGQGFDGWVPDETVGIGVDARNPVEISRAILGLLGNGASEKREEFAKTFSWESVSARYASLYRASLEG